MMRLHDPSVLREKKVSKDGQVLRDLSAINRPQIACPKRISNRIAILGMAIGYLGLVVILASTPIWSQVLLPYKSSLLACIDAGGSR